MDIIMPLFSLPPKCPCWHTGRLWLMQIGYYKLNAPKDQATDWVWIVDHSVQLGAEKCLVILGVRLSKAPLDRALRYDDVEPIELLPVTKSNGDIVYEQLESTVQKTGVPREIIGDHGSDLKAGIERFCRQHQETCYVYDIKHKLALLVEAKLEKEPDWKTFLELATATRHQVQQTPLAALGPPAQRSKSRYMNVDILVNWGQKVIRFMENDLTDIAKDYKLSQVNEKLGWVNGYKGQIAGWTELVDIIGCTENVIRTTGLYRGAPEALAEQLKELTLTDYSCIFVDKVLEFARDESQKAKEGERLIGSSEVIESLFGKQKLLEKGQSKSGFTGLLLALPACVSKTTDVIIKQAMETVPIKAIQQWYKDNIHQSVQAKRVLAFKTKKPTEIFNEKEQNQHQLMLAA